MAQSNSGMTWAAQLSPPGWPSLASLANQGKCNNCSTNPDGDKSWAPKAIPGLLTPGHSDSHTKSRQRLKHPATQAIGQVSGNLISCVEVVPSLLFL